MREGLGGSSAELLHKLRRRSPIFTFHDALEISGYEKNYLGLVLHNLEESGWIERIEKGKYLILPIEARSGEYTLHEFIVGSFLVDPSVVAYWSAFHHHGFTEQIPNVVFIQTTSRKRKRELRILNIRYKIIKIVDRKFFGWKKIWLDGEKIDITDTEKTIIDCLDKPKHCGGITEVNKAFISKEFDADKLTEYLKKFDSGAVAKRCSYLADKNNVELEIPRRLRKKGINLLDPSMPKKGDVDREYGLLINVRIPS